MDHLDGNLEALKIYQREQQSGEEQLQEAMDLIDSRLDETIEEVLRPLVNEINGLDYGLDGRDLVMEHLGEML